MSDEQPALPRCKHDYGPPELCPMCKEESSLAAPTGLADTVKSNNGDTLKELNERWQGVYQRRLIARHGLEEAKAAYARACAALETVESEAANIQTRMDIWWREQREKQNVS